MVNNVNLYITMKKIQTRVAYEFILLLIVIKRVRMQNIKTRKGTGSNLPVLTYL